MVLEINAIENMTHNARLEFLNSVFVEILSRNKCDKKDELQKFHKYFVANKNFEFASITMSILAIYKYKDSKNSYYDALLLLNDAKYLANSINSMPALKFNISAQGYIEFLNNNLEIALDNIKTAQLIQAENALGKGELDNFIIKLKLEIEKEKMNTDNKTFIPPSNSEDPFLALLKVGRTVSVETNIDNLLNIIAEEIKHVLNADRCTVFMLDEEKGELWSKVATGVESKEIRFPSNMGIAGYVATTGETVNIEDAYADDRFNKEIDMQTEYKTRNILCMPIVNIKHQIVGVFQVLNKFDGSFTQKDEEALIAIGATAGIAIDNAVLFDKQEKLIQEQKDMMASFIDTLSTSLDARDKITAGHSRRVTLYTKLICDAINLSESEKNIIEQASLLHDIGKIGIKDSVLQKEGKLTDDEYAHIKEHAHLTHLILGKVYNSGEYKDIATIAASHHEKFDGSGYWQKLKGKDIPIGGRILAIADVFDAITSKRHYRSRMEIEKVVQILLDGKNTHFDGDLVEVFLNITVDKIVEIFIDGTEITLDKQDYDIFKNV
ncbi:GAF domain-containing protein, partial [bacterium]|nr:GAF domain-containing protein [bacterium]